jgi:hypothetical protein
LTIYQDGGIMRGLIGRSHAAPLPMSTERVNSL